MRKSKGRNIGFLLLAVVFAAGAALIAANTVRSFNETEAVVVALKDLPAYAEIKTEDVKVVETPAASVPKDAFLRIEEVQGKYLRYPVFAGEVLRAARLADTHPDKGLMAARLSALKRPDLRAFSLPYDETIGVGGEVKEGDRVDIVASVKIETGARGQVGLGKIVARNVVVLKTVKGEDGDKGTIVLALTPGQIEDIAFALTSGQVRLALNPYETDEQAAETPGVTGPSWLEKYGFKTAPTGGAER
jgi:pilus assembly protein CpaB